MDVIVSLGLVSGTITTQTWTAVNSPYRVTGEVTVPAGETLTIEPGVDVLFDEDVRFHVSGSLDAVGTATDSIRFVAGTAAEWGGLGISEGSIAYARFSNGHADGGSGGYSDGGALYVGSQGVVELDHCVIAGNVANGSGGAAKILPNGNATFLNCLIYGNQSGSNTVNATSSTCTLVNCTIVGNVGRGVQADKGGGVVSLTNCIVWGNSNSFGWEVGHSPPAVANYCNIGQDPGILQGSTGNINADPLFVDAANGDFRLTEQSPCINTGDPSSPLDPNGTRADMGAIPSDWVIPDWPPTADAGGPYTVKVDVPLELVGAGSDDNGQVAM